MVNVVNVNVNCSKVAIGITIDWHYPDRQITVDVVVVDLDGGG
jgi:hypothetical protein